MDLKDFVSGTIVQIVDGIIDAQTQCRSKGVIINPLLATNNTFKDDSAHRTRDGKVAQVVKYDVALTVKDEAEVKGGFAIVAGAFSLGSAGKSGSEDSSISRIRFNVPIVLPSDEKP
ncbi:MAG: hypothetical protein KKD44_05290 [Proteobacteria bacterium]|nr:hypothetical protein [Pseudomonadota bacterium]